MTIAYTTGQITLTNGSAVVTGIGTAWAVSLIAGGMIAAEAGGNLLPIESVDSDTSITAAIEWKGATGTYDYALVRDTAYLQQLNVNSNTLARLIAELDAGTIFKYDASGDLAGRSTYDERGKGFSYLIFIGVSEPALYVKASATSGDWDGPFAYGTGPVGPEGPAGYVNFRGSYGAATAYARNDGALYNGSSFVALQDTTGNAPPTLPATSNVYWQLLAIKGTDGSGTGDVVGPAGTTDDTPAFFDGTTGKLIKSKTKSQFKIWLASAALDISFDNSIANLSGSPSTVQAAINALAGSGGKNDALFAIEIADLKGVKMGMVGGVVDAFDDTTGISSSGSSNYVYDAANDWLSPSFVAGSDQIPTMTASTTSGVTMSASSVYDVGYEAWRAGDKNSTSIWSASLVVSPHWLKADYGSAKTIGSYSIRARPEASRATDPSAFTLEGSNDNSGWTVVDTRTAIAWTVGELKSFTIASPQPFRYYRLNISATTGGGASSCAIAEITMSTTTAYNNMTLVSVDYAASSTPSTARLAVQLADPLALTQGTDFTMEVSRDGGTTWTAVPLTLTMPLFGGVKMYEGTVSISGQPSGSTMKWRLKTLTNKNVIASGVVLQQS